MELSQFVQRTLEEILDGVKASHEKMKAVGSAVSGTLQGIEFDVAVTATEKGESSKKGGIVVWGIGAAVEGKAEATSSTVSRVKFTVPIRLPPL